MRPVDGRQPTARHSDEIRESRGRPARSTHTLEVRGDQLERNRAAVRSPQ